MFLSLGIQRLATDYQSRIQLFSQHSPSPRALPSLHLSSFQKYFKGTEGETRTFSSASCQEGYHNGRQNQARLSLHGSETVCSSPGLTRKHWRKCLVL